ncbi:MAG: phosphonate ABC transporter ATP-binding protein [Pseudopedobacter saltans]|uniref:Phosphonate ABC transporter ATP-binding protein n=1 Tax=Pseudopedobacter saltans TaxID=151895 RepID=A0A2W5EMC1_9SPHI|nr:MAG: phosphonate ABC transporter ATP-binding protein [Pseudopedobacter saltans]
MIRLDSIHKEYKQRNFSVKVLKNISLQIMRQDFLAVMGPSGCGKTTLLNILGILDKPTSGNFQYENKNLYDLDERELAFFRQKHIGFVFQNFNLIEHLTVYENVELPLSYTNRNKKERREVVSDLLSQFGLYNYADFFPSQLSGGQQQRTAIARAIAPSPKIILADEPTGNLDSKNGNQVMEILSQLNDNGTTVVMVTHSDYDARYAKRVVYMQDGEILMERKNGLSGSLI